jgi:hypothetical protein
MNDDDDVGGLFTSRPDLFLGKKLKCEKPVHRQTRERDDSLVTQNSKLGKNMEEASNFINFNEALNVLTSYEE